MSVYPPVLEATKLLSYVLLAIAGCLHNLPQRVIISVENDLLNIGITYLNVLAMELSS